MNGDNKPDADGQFENALYFNFNDGKLKFDNNWTSNANTNYGSASAFVRESLAEKKRRKIRFFSY